MNKKNQNQGLCAVKKSCFYIKNKKYLNPGQLEFNLFEIQHIYSIILLDNIKLFLYLF